MSATPEGIGSKRDVILLCRFVIKISPLKPNGKYMYHLL
jgi:hypothetical protein